MSYNTQLQTNNETIQSLIDTVNSLPNAPISVVQATPTVTVNASGLITATATQTAGYVNAGTKSATKQLAFQPAKTITPSTTSQIAVSSGYYTGGNITVAGDSNLVAGNIKSGVSIFGVAGSYEGSGGTDGEDSLIQGTISTYTNDRVTSIGRYAFAYYNLTNVNFPNVTYIGSNAFFECSRLTSVNFPKAITISSCAFSNCTSLTSVNFPSATTIGSSAFWQCTSLTSVNFPSATTIGSSAFRYCTSLTSVNFPKASTIGGSAFRECSSLTSVSFPSATFIQTYAFYSCTNLSTIYLTGSSLCRLNGSMAFSQTGIWSTKGSIFVPSSLVASYKAATNWVFFSNRIFGI